LPKNPIIYIDISLFAHATENIDKVMEAVKTIIPPPHIDEVTFKKSKLKGEYGNPVTVLRARIKKQEIIKVIVDRISKSLSESDKNRILQELELRLDRSNLYLRLDKQWAFRGSLKLCRADPIHLKIHFKTNKQDEIIGICRRMGIMP